jgi:hypothetical protein
LLSESTKALPTLGQKEITQYLGIIGKLMYALTGTRFDLAFSVGVLSRYNHAPSSHHLAMTKHVLAYLKKTNKAIIKYNRGSGPLLLQCYVDADFANEERRQSTTGFIMLLNSSPIAWTSSIQKTVATSTTEAEYIALFEATRLVIWLQQLLSELGFPQQSLTAMHEDSQICISFTRDDASHNRTKHINVKYHFTREKITEGAIYIEDTRTEDQLADLLTKQQSVERHWRDCRLLSMILEPP